MERSHTLEQSKEMEKMSWEPDLSVDYIRHGLPTYSPAEYKSLDFQGKIKEKDKGMVVDAAKELAETIDPGKELVVIWETPKQRGRETSAIFQNVLQKKGIPVLETGRGKSTSFASLSDVGLSPELVEYLTSDGLDNWQSKWAAIKEPLGEGAETPADVRKRSMRALANIERAARLVNPEGGKKLRFLVFGHEESVRDLLETSLGVGTDKGSGPGYAERVHVDIKGGIPEENEPARLRVTYRNRTSEIGFDIKKRQLVKKT
jgi:broad specificity phosphatase PhoE